jgi:hypothetical protein
MDRHAWNPITAASSAAFRPAGDAVLGRQFARQRQQCKAGCRSLVLPFGLWRIEGRQRLEAFEPPGQVALVVRQPFEERPPGPAMMLSRRPLDRIGQRGAGRHAVQFIEAAESAAPQGMSSSRTACPAFVRCPPSIIVVPMVRSPVDTMNACQRVTDRAAPVRLARCFPRPLPRL